MINKAVANILKNDTALTALVGVKVYPVIMPEKTKAPCVVFFSALIDVNYDKSGAVVDETKTTIICFSKSYPDSVDIIAAARAAMDGKKGDFNGVRLILSRVQDGSEGYDLESDTYYQEIHFILKSSNI